MGYNMQRRHRNLERPYSGDRLQVVVHAGEDQSTYRGDYVACHVWKWAARRVGLLSKDYISLVMPVLVCNIARCIVDLDRSIKESVMDSVLRASDRRSRFDKG